MSPVRSNRHRARYVSWPLVFFFLLSCFRASAHTVLLSRGEAVVHDGRIAVEIEVWAEDFLHYYAILPDASGHISWAWLGEAAERHAQTIEESLILRDEDGQRLIGEPAQLRWDAPVDGAIQPEELHRLRARYDLVFQITLRPRLLTFQFRWIGDQAVIPSQLVLDVRGSDQPSGDLVRLTSRGNAETIEVHWHDRKATVDAGWIDATRIHACAQGAGGPARWKEIFAEIEARAQELEARVFIPLPLLETWIPLPRRDEDFLSLGEQQAALAAIAALIQAALSVETDGNPIPAEILEIAFLPANARRSSLSAPDLSPLAKGGARGGTPISIWTGRLAARLRFRVESTHDQVTLRWNLFNNAVLSVTAALRVGTRCTERVFSTYESIYTWTLDLQRLRTGDTE